MQFDSMKFEGGFAFVRVRPDAEGGIFVIGIGKHESIGRTAIVRAMSTQTEVDNGGEAFLAEHVEVDRRQPGSYWIKRATVSFEDDPDCHGFTRIIEFAPNANPIGPQNSELPS